MSAEVSGRGPLLPPIGSKNLSASRPPTLSAKDSRVARRASLEIPMAGLGFPKLNTTSAAPSDAPSDPWSSLFPSDTNFSKLTNVEAQRVMSVLQECQRKILLLSLLPDYIDKRVTVLFGAELTALVQVRLRQHATYLLTIWISLGDL
jgi:hypothetical protein